MKDKSRNKASELATIVRSKNKLPAEGQIPVEKLAEDLSIEVSRRNLLRDIHATANIEGDNPEIVLDSGLNQLRERFTIAHEIGHFLIESSTISGIPSPNISNLSDQEIEGFCNEFAAQLLVPDLSIQNISKWENFSIRGVADRGRDIGVAIEPTLRRVLEVAKGDGGLLLFDRVDGINKDRPFKLQRGLFPSSNIHSASNTSLIIPFVSDNFDPLLSAYEEGTEHLLYNMSFNLEPFPGKFKMVTAVRAKSYNEQLLLVLVPPNVDKSKLNTTDTIV